MTLLVTCLAAVAATVVWYVRREDDMRIGTLCLMLWGASIMWLADAVCAYLREGSSVFVQEISQMANDAFLGFSAVALALVIWLAILLVSDPRGRSRKKLYKG